MYLEQIGAYWDTRAEGYSLTIHEQFETSVGEYFRDLLKNSAPGGKALSCLDAGCGPGFFSILLAQEGHTVTAVDYSEEMLRRARDNFLEIGVEVSTLRGDVQSLPFQDESFDYIVSRNLIWNLEHPENAYREWMRLLRPGGRLLIADGNHYLYYYDEEYLRAKDQDRSGDNHRCYGVDPTPINEIARDLPLSRVHRPQWDIEKFLNLGVCRINFEVSRKSFTDNVSNEKKSVVSDFVLCVEKPSSTQPLNGKEEQRKIDEHWSAASDNYSRIIHDELNSFRVDAWIKKILANAPRKDALDVLDAGCGPAFFSIVLSRNGHRVIGLDSSGDMLKHAASNCFSARKKAEFKSHKKSA
jgi:ubiquinone/menaquinone biosynthesis C-methylase UbiE